MKSLRERGDAIVARVMTAHRVVLIAGTAMLAVATSRLANDVGDEGSWVLAVGAGCVMYAADILGSVETASEELRRSTPGQLPKGRDATRIDVYRSRAPRMTLPVMLGGSLLILFGLLWPTLK